MILEQMHLFNRMIPELLNLFYRMIPELLNLFYRTELLNLFCRMILELLNLFFSMIPKLLNLFYICNDTWDSESVLQKDTWASESILQKDTWASESILSVRSQSKSTPSVGSVWHSASLYKEENNTSFYFQYSCSIRNSFKRSMFIDQYLFALWYRK